MEEMPDGMPDVLFVTFDVDTGAGNKEQGYRSTFHSLEEAVTSTDTSVICRYEKKEVIVARMNVEILAREVPKPEFIKTPRPRK